MLEHHKDKKEEKLEVKWEEVEQQMEDMLNIVKTYKPSTDSTDVILKNGEAQYYRLRGADLIEPRRAPMHRVGAYGGPTVHVGKVPIHMGAFYATQTKPRQDILTVVDSGTVVITNQRIIFKGNRYSKTLQLAKLVDYEDDPMSKTVTFFAETSSKSIGVSYGDAKLFTTYVEMAIADMTNNRASLISKWESSIKEHQASKPLIKANMIPPIPGDGKVPQGQSPYLNHDPALNLDNLDSEKSAKIETPEATNHPNNISKTLPQASQFPPAWYVDPYKQAQYRWWNGVSWTSYTS